MKNTVFWDLAPCSLVEIDRRLKGAFCLHQDKHLWNINYLVRDYTTIIDFMMEAVSTSETSLDSYELFAATFQKMTMAYC
jgi:hypothetical protein